MSGRASAARYARALLEVAISDADPAQVGRELQSFVALVDGHAQLKDVITNPSVPAAAKHRVVEELASKVSLASPLAKLLLMLADRDRLGLLSELNAVYQERLLEHQHVLQAEVTSAMPLEASAIEALQARLSAATGQKVMMTAKVDPALIGGLVARIGSMVYDGSVSSQLTKMRAHLLQEK